MKIVSVSRRAEVRPTPASTRRLKVLSSAPLNAPSWAPSKLVVAIEAITTAAEPGTVAHFVAAENGRRTPSRPSLTAEAAEPPEHAEVDREDLPRATPLLDAEQGHHRQRVAAVDEGGDRRRVRVEPHRDPAAGAVDDLQPDDRDQADRGGPAPQPLRIAQVGRPLAGQRREPTSHQPARPPARG